MDLWGSGGGGVSVGVCGVGHLAMNIRAPVFHCVVEPRLLHTGTERQDNVTQHSINYKN